MELEVNHLRSLHSQSNVRSNRVRSRDEITRRLEFVTVDGKRTMQVTKQVMDSLLPFAPCQRDVSRRLVNLLFLREERINRNVMGIRNPAMDPERMGAIRRATFALCPTGGEGQEQVWKRKQCIEQENKFDFLKDLVENVPTISCEDDDSNSGSIQSDKLPNSRRNFLTILVMPQLKNYKFPINFDEPSSDEDSFESDESESKDERQRHPAETSNASSANSSSSSHPPFHTVPQSYHNSFPYPGQLASGAMYPSAMPPPTMPPPPLLPPQHGALSGNTPAMGAYLAPQPQASRNNDNDEDSDEDYDA
nr:uncharacterized protein LOC129265208 [Lytechinus pictus]